MISTVETMAFRAIYTIIDEFYMQIKCFTSVSFLLI